MTVAKTQPTNSAAELRLAKYAVNVQDSSKQPVAGAVVTVTGANFTESGVTDDKGCYTGAAELHKFYSMTIAGPGFAPWIHKFSVYLQSELSVRGKNFPIIVVNASDIPVSGASVTVSSPKPHNTSGVTNALGIFDGSAEKDYLNTVTIAMPGFQNYTNDFAPYVKVFCLDASIVVIPVITLNCLPPKVYTVTGGGSYCSGDHGVALGMEDSELGIIYQVYLGTTPVGSHASGTGAALGFGKYTAAGNYTVIATNVITGCTSIMKGSPAIIIYPLPVPFTVTGGGSYCSNEKGKIVGLSASQIGVNYQLYRNGTAVGNPATGTGSAISFGLQTIAGIYTAVGTNVKGGCKSNMVGSVTVVVNHAPTVSANTNYVAQGKTIMLAGTPAGGIWTSSAPVVASVGRATGVVTGISLGIANMTYSLANGCVSTIEVIVTKTGQPRT